MKTTVPLLFATIAIVLFLFVTPACCSSGCARTGDTMSMVVGNCGEPTWVDSREEWRMRAVPAGAILDGWYVAGYPRVVQVLTHIEEWTYDLGRNKFTRILTFEDGFLISIKTGGYGGR